MTLSAALVALAIGAANQAPSAAELIEKARDEARSSKKAVFVSVGASWCKWCTRFDSFLADKTVAPILSSHFVTVRLVGFEVEKQKALETPGVYEAVDWLGGRKAGLPFLAILNADGKLLASSMKLVEGHAEPLNIGFPTTLVELEHFSQMLRRGAPDIGEEQLASLQAALLARSGN